MEKEDIKLIIGAFVVFMILVVFTSHEEPASIITGGTWDISKQVSSNGYDQYLVEEPDFDYSNPAIYNAAQNIKLSTSSADEAVKAVAQYVVHNVDYAYVDTSYCYNEKASDVLASGKGDCVSMSRLVTAMLRAQGIPARTMGGCLTSQRCSALFAVIPKDVAQTTPMQINDFKKRGFLHEYVEFWTPKYSEWGIVEATVGVIFPMDCKSYLDYGYDSSGYSRCVINDLNFWQTCSSS